MKLLEYANKTRKKYKEERNVFQAIRDYLMRIWGTISRKMSDIKYTIKRAFQRMFKGYDNRLLWRTDIYLTERILKALYFHRDKSSCIICINNEELRKHMKDEISNEKIEKLNKKRLNTMIDGFEIMKNNKFFGRTEKHQRKINKSLKLFAEYFECFWE